jgi:hypothetical protein
MKWTKRPLNDATVRAPGRRAMADDEATVAEAGVVGGCTVVLAAPAVGAPRL